jgi:hypothetical protein
LTPAALQGHLQGLTEKLRRGLQGRVREAIEQTIAKILVDADGTMTIEARPDGLLGIEGRFAPLGCRGTGTNVVHTVRTGQKCWVGKRNFCCVCSRFAEDPPAYPGAEEVFADNRLSALEICRDQPGRSRPMDDRRKPGETPVTLLGTR